MAMPHKTVLALLVATVLAGCGGRDDVTLSRIRHTGNGPDEFSIMPGKPLQAPEDYASLPSPTPGGVNRTDQNPLADGVAALGGNPAALTAGAPSARDGALVNHASGSTPTPKSAACAAMAPPPRQARRPRNKPLGALTIPSGCLKHHS